jgi:hypothetical protein
MAATKKIQMKKKISLVPDGPDPKLDEISSVCIHGTILYHINRIVWNSANNDNPKGDVEIIQVANDAKSYKTSNPEI